jgi:hypothetical protein
MIVPTLIDLTEQNNTRKASEEQSATVFLSDSNAIYARIGIVWNRGVEEENPCHMSALFYLAD